MTISENKSSNMESLISHKKYVVVIPAFNEVESIFKVVQAVNTWGSVIVVDDGCTDGTANQALDAGAHVVRHGSNLGYDKAIETGIKEAQRLGYMFAVTVDADGQHNPKLLQNFQNQLELGADVVVGIRDYKQRWSEYVFGWVGQIIWNLQDPLCGMKAYRLEYVKKFDEICTYSSIGTELAIKIIKSGGVCAQIFVDTKPRLNSSRFGLGLKPNIKIMKSLIHAILF
jgi:glycosyltransferase involved in cell wall biosynthesis